MTTLYTKYYKTNLESKHLQESKGARMMSVFAYYMIINLRAIKKHSAVEKDFSSMRSGRLPCKLFEYFQA